MKLSVEGYKSIAEKRSVDITGLTILSGPNSSGKSSFMQPLLLIKQTLENDYDAGSLMLDGANVNLTDSSEIISKVPYAAKDSFTISLIESDAEVTASYKFRKRRGVYVDYIYHKSGEFKDGITIRLTQKSSEIQELFANQPLNRLGETIGKGKKVTWKVERDRCFLEVRMNIAGQSLPFMFGLSPAQQLVKLATRLIHVPGLRGNPERSYRVASSEYAYPGSFEKYVASIVHRWKSDKRYAARFSTLKEQLAQLGLASSIDTVSINETRLQLRISRYRGCHEVLETDYVNIADVGFGVSQTLPVLVALLAARKGQLVYIEQPELHLHPKAQYNLARIIASAVTERNVKVVIETHSALLIRGIQTLVAQKKLSGEVVTLNWFIQDAETGQTNITVATLDHAGAFGDWPEDFDSVALDAEKCYLDAVEEALGEV